MHPNNRLLFEKYALDHFKSGMRVLEIGPDSRPSTHERLVKGIVPAVTWETADLDASFDEHGGLRFSDSETTADYRMSSEYEIPLPSGAFDVVLAAQVIEHVRQIWIWIREVARVCRPGGLVILICPVTWPYHEAPVDCWRIYPEGMKTLAAEAGLEVLECRFESLEPRPTRRSYPGRSLTAPILVEDRGLRGWARKLLGWPLPVAYDTIFIGRRPG